MGGANSKSNLTAAVTRLATFDVDPSDYAFWDEIWKTPLKVDEIFEVVSQGLVKKIVTQKHKNIKTLFSQAVAQLYQVVETPYPVYFGQALTCLRVLARFVPAMVVTNSPKMIELLWKKRRSTYDATKSRSTPVKTTKNERDHTSAESVPNLDYAITDAGNAPESRSSSDIPSASPRQTIDAPDSEPLAVILVNSLFHMLFLPDFTIEDPKQEFLEADMNSEAFMAALMWSPGVGWGRQRAVTGGSPFDSNRIEVLRLLIAVLSDTLAQSPSSFDPCASYWLEVATSVDAPYADIVFYSLLNTVLGYDPVGWGVPYAGLLVTDTTQQLAEVAAQCLLVLLDYGYPIDEHCHTHDTLDTPYIAAATETSLPGIAPDQTESKGFNIFRRLLWGLADPPSLLFMFRGFSRLLNNQHESRNTLLPRAVPRAGMDQELLVLLWKCLDECPAFLPFILREVDVNELLVPICYLMLEGRRDPSRIGALHLCTFLLLKLSGDRDFALALNRVCTVRLPLEPPVPVPGTGPFTHADLLVITLHKIIVAGSGRLTALYNCFLTTICNISPYFRSLGSVASVKLVSLLHLFSSPRFLFAAETNYTYVALLLETINNVAQYQYDANPHLMYALVKRKAIYDSLVSLSLPDGPGISESANEKGKVHGSGLGGPKVRKWTSKQSQRPQQFKDDEEGAHAQAPTHATDLVTTHPVLQAAVAPVEDTEDGGKADVTNHRSDPTCTDNSYATGSPRLPPVNFTQSQAVLQSVLQTNALEEMALSVTQHVLESALAQVNSEDRRGNEGSASATPLHSETDLEDAPQACIKPPVGDPAPQKEEKVSLTSVHNDSNIVSGPLIATETHPSSRNDSKIDSSTAVATTSTNGDAQSHTNSSTVDLPPPSSSQTQLPEYTSAQLDDSISRHDATPEETQEMNETGVFIPTRRWLESVKAQLPLLTGVRMLRHLVPLVDRLTNEKKLEEGQILSILRDTTLVGLLPVPHPVVTRKYQPNKYTSLWFSAYMWGVIFVHNQEIALFDCSTVNLFSVTTGSAKN